MTAFSRRSLCGAIVAGALLSPVACEVAPPVCDLADFSVHSCAEVITEIHGEGACADTMYTCISCIDSAGKEQECAVSDPTTPCKNWLLTFLHDGACTLHITVGGVQVTTHFILNIQGSCPNTEPDDGSHEIALACTSR